MEKQLLPTIKELFKDASGAIQWSAIFMAVILGLTLFVGLDRYVLNTTAEEIVVIVDKRIERYSRNSSDDYYLKIQHLEYHKTATIEVSHGVYESVGVGETAHINVLYGGITGIPYSGTLKN